MTGFQAPSKGPSGPLPFQRHFHFCPRRVSMDMTRQDRMIKTVPIGTTRLKTLSPGEMERHSWLWFGNWLHRAWERHSWAKLDPLELAFGLSQRRPAGLREPQTAVCLRKLQTATCLREPQTAVLISPQMPGLRDSQTEQNRKTKDLKRENKNKVSGRCLLCRSGLLSWCTQRGRTRNTRRG